MSVYLPVTDRRAEVSPPRQEDVAPDAEGRKVLLVEDEDGVRRACRRILEGAGYEVAEASNAAEALADFDPRDFDVVVTDVVMPGELSGRDLVREIHAVRPHLPAVFMSGYSRDAIAKRGVLDEGITVVQKPFTPAELLGKVGAALAGTSAG